MKKLLSVVVLLVSMNLVSFHFEQTSQACSDLAKYSLFAHFAFKADQAAKPEIKNYIGTHLFGSAWQTQDLVVAHDRAQQTLMQLVPADGSNELIGGVQDLLTIDKAIMIKHLLEQAALEAPNDVVNFIEQHTPHNVFVELFDCNKLNG